MFMPTWRECGHFTDADECAECDGAPTCHNCSRSRRDAVVVREIATESGPVWTLYGCGECFPNLMEAVGPFEPQPPVTLAL